MKKILYLSMLLSSCYSIAQKVASVVPSNPPPYDINSAMSQPNSYIFDPYQSQYDGIYIPIIKAYAMWQNNEFFGNTPIPAGTISADVLWEDSHGLVKSGASYSLEFVDSNNQVIPSSQVNWSSSIKVPINKSKEGNAVIAFKVNGEVYWSWHVWVTDDPTANTALKYKSFPNLTKELPDGTIVPILDSEWQWMDRNLGALSSSLTGTEWNKNGGLLYQWGRKDPIPPLVYRGNDFYEVSGSIGRVRHGESKNLTNATSFDNLIKYVLFSNAEVNSNIKLSVKNPLSLIYVNKDDNSGQAYYNNNTDLPLNWFGNSTILLDANLSELNLWSDNSKGTIATNYNSDASAAPYRAKSPFDPCPSGWRVPSMLVANLASLSRVDDIRIDFSPFGPRGNMSRSDFVNNGYNVIKPNDNNTPANLKGIKAYMNVGLDFSNVGGFNMGIFPGTGQILRKWQNGRFADQHHVGLWTATMTKHFDGTPPVNARSLFMIADKGQPDVPDSNYPNIKGDYRYDPSSNYSVTSDTNGCRCIKDPIGTYNVPTKYITTTLEYKDGLNNPNTYQYTQSATPTTVSIPISKAFSVQSQILNNATILNPTSFNNLKVNVLWTDNQSLINNISIDNPSPTSLAQLSNTNIKITLNSNSIGNAVVTLHNGSITNPVYWSWHIWVTSTPLSSYTYTTELPNADAVNYINYVGQQGNVMKTEFMDRNLGARNAFPNVVNPSAPTPTEISLIKTSSSGVLYQWGRKDPLPLFQNGYDLTNYNVYLGTVSATGTVSYTTLTPATYNNLSGSYIIPYNTYTNSSNANLLTTDKVSDKINKVLSYSIKNPLVFMVPSTLAPYNAGYTSGTDWLLNEPNLFPERWGRGVTKSPFDPCPEGWRIPDLTNIGTDVINFGMSPWYKKDLNITSAYNIMNNYLGTRVINGSTTSTAGYMFQNTANNYQIGNYPKTGTKGSRNVLANESATGTFNITNFQYPSYWTSALNANYLGRAIRLLFDMESKANLMTVLDNNTDPYFAGNCRCVKVKKDASGKEEGPILRLQVTSLTNKAATDTFSKNEVFALQKSDKITVFPNPVKDELYIDAKDGVYYYQIYDVAGQKVKEGKFEDKQTNISSLQTGIYFIRINDSSQLIKIIKK